ncbi:hypothetical protein Goklo_014403 [Gossypium klotzschianum]|uniref:Uncharacterized protein n=1 Tax=Gossypium klotzschianum TaxID=34286 RepID=A0A7J8U7H1_9ROSI|nr:hypothetical protein [Gossypium klotzschianum]
MQHESREKRSSPVTSALEDRVVTLNESTEEVNERIRDVNDRINNGLQTIQ